MSESRLKPSTKTHALVFVCLLYLTFSLACDPLAFRQISIDHHIMGGSSLLYGALYILLDAITRLEGKKFAIIMVFIFHLFDLIFTYTLYLINLLPPPDSFKNLSAFHTIISPLPSLFWAGILGALVAGILEVLIFTFFQKKTKKFWLASFFSTSIILVGHNIPTYYFSIRYVFPDTYQQMLVINTIIEATVALVLSLLINKVLFRQKLQNTACPSSSPPV